MSHLITVLKLFTQQLFFFLIYLAVLGLGCSMQDLQLQHAESSPLTRDGIWAPCIWNTVCTTGLLQKSPATVFKVLTINPTLY